MRVKEIEESVKILRQAIKSIPEGDVQSAMPKRIRPKKVKFIRDMNPLEVMLDSILEVAEKICLKIKNAFSRVLQSFNTE